MKEAVSSMDELSESSRRLGDVLGEVGRIAAGVIGGLIGFSIMDEVRDWVADSVEAFAAFEASAARLASLSAEAGQSVQALSASFRVAASAISRELSVSGRDAIDALEALVKAGLSGSEAIGALRGAIMMARLEGVGFAEAGNSLVQVMAQFGVAGREAARVVDTLVNASRLGIGSAGDFAQGLANVGATARGLGLSLEETAAWLVVLERRLGSAHEAGTHLNRFLLDLYEIAGKLGVPIRNVDGSLRSAGEVMLEVIGAARALGGDFKALQDRLQGVDARAVRALLTFTQMTESLEDLRAEIGRSGAAWEAYRSWLETAEGRMAALRAENDRLMRSIGEGAAAIYNMVAPAFLALANAFVTAWRGIVGAVTGVKLERYLAYVETQVRVLGRASEEAAAQWIKGWVDMGEITLAEGLKIAESVGIYNDAVQELIDRAVQAGATVPEAFRAMASAADASSRQASESVRLVEERVRNLQNELRSLSTAFDVLSEGVSLGSSFYDVVLSVARAMGVDVQLTEEARASRERLAAAQEVLNYVSQAGALVQQALQLSMLGATDASNMLLNALTSLTSSLQDGIVTNEEFVNLLSRLGVDAQNVAGSLHNVLIQALNATREAIQGNIDKVNEFRGSLLAINGMTVHTYHYHHVITVHEGGGGEAVAAEAAPSAQHGAWYTREGLYYLHRGEMVLPRDLADLVRRGAGTGPVAGARKVNINVNVRAGGAADPRSLAEAVSRELVKRLRAM